MSLWTRIIDALDALTSGEGFSEAIERLTTPPEKSVAFAIAAIGIGAKIAKADGLVTRDEVKAFREVFNIPPEEEQNAARIFNLARQDVGGYETYARTIERMFRTDHQVLMDLLEGLFYIAMADGEYHPGEDRFLARTAEIFGLTDREFAAIRSRAVPGAEPDPYTVLGVSHDDDLDTIRKAWRKMVRQSHPDQMIARGVPKEALQLANRQLAAINDAWKKVQADKGAA